ncbi:hypothetical protein OF83DRAFT_1177968 [Amylostereum chailletii]|nr:hypothetical protein OF83DRAFT_1177968 [Amylostereum chailletii]
MDAVHGPAGGPSSWIVVFSAFAHLRVLETSSASVLQLLAASLDVRTVLFPRLRALNLSSLHLTAALARTLGAFLRARQPALRRVGLTNVSIREGPLRALRAVCAVDWRADGRDDVVGFSHWPGMPAVQAEPGVGGSEEDEGPYVLEPGRWVGGPQMAFHAPPQRPDMWEYDFADDDDDDVAEPLVVD